MSWLSSRGKVEMTRICTLFVLAGLLGIPAFSQTENRVIGTIEATIDNIEGTWYVIASGEPANEKTTAMWMDRGSGLALAVVSGFDSPAVTFTRREGAATMEPISGTVIAISFLFSRNETERVIEFPTGPEDPTTVVFQPNAGDYQDLYALEEGEMTVEEITAVSDGVYRFEGSFSGLLLPLQGSHAVEVTEASFVFDEVRLFGTE